MILRKIIWRFPSCSIPPYHKPWLKLRENYHPRLMVRKSKLDELRANVEKEKDSKAYRLYEYLLGVKLTCIDGIDFATERGNEFTEGGWGQVIISPKGRTTRTKFKIVMEIEDDEL